MDVCTHCRKIVRPNGDSWERESCNCLSKPQRRANDKGYVTDPGLEWIYPQDEEPPRGVKLALLTIGGVMITGPWAEDGSVVAWQRLFKRNKEKEAKYETFNLAGTKLHTNRQNKQPTRPSEDAQGHDGSAAQVP